MRTDITHNGANELTYEIREITEVAKNIENYGKEIIWENIGDPIIKGESVPQWIKDIIIETVKDDDSYKYCPTKGLLETREYIANENNKKNGAQITPEEVLFFNGLGEAITKIYGLLKKESRVIGPSPAYPTHSSTEALHSNCHPLMYIMDEKNCWNPDIDDLYKKIKYNPTVSGILVINPGNPTGAVYSKKVLNEIVDLANEYDLFILCDEIYHNLVYNSKKHTYLSKVIDDVCGISLKGISKELPWPGARCGWMETYNYDKDPYFKKYIDGIVKFKMVEVCSTTLPQKIIPKVMSNPKFKKYLEERNNYYEKASNYAYNKLSKINGVIVNKTNGAFYSTVVFEEGVLNENQKLNIDNKNLENYVNNVSQNQPLDKRFVYNLMGNCGLCVVPMSSFNSELNGFRATTLERDFNKLKYTYDILSEKIEEYINSN